MDANIKLKLPKIPKIIDKDFIDSIILVHCFFNDTKKCERWFNTKNPHFGNIKPQDLLIMGRSNKVKSMVEAMLDGNYP